MKDKFIANGYGVIVGEYGAMARLNLGSSDLNASYAGFRRYYIQYITQSMAKHGLVPVYWDNGGTGNKSMGIFNRKTGEVIYPELVKAIINTTDSIKAVKIVTGQN
jgi:endoglucanase